ncbi:FAD-binding protein [Kitasatospora sp. NPDC002227]|uniref:FAD-binding protein n=1 Tax=Kitasatospora sp. NPDC002227 TaxID=3154773 RepID=UPI00332D54B9
MSPSDRRVDVLVVGAGPAGLAAAHSLRGSALSTLLVDGGKPVHQRDRDRSSDMTRGHGGAGLFSDGKFSFYPSASRLWTLPHRSELRAAYEWTCQVLRAAGLDTPPFPDEPDSFAIDAGEWVLKEYPSYYLSLPARLALSATLVAESEAELLTETEVVDLVHAPQDDVFRAVLRDGTGARTRVEARRVVVATGRFGPLALNGLLTPRLWRRLEVGFRIEQPAGEAFFRSMKQLDPKLRFRSDDGRVEWRTFCACRQGEAVATETEGLWTVSGRADCPATGRSNIGFNTRILDEAVAERALSALLRAAAAESSGFDEPLLEVLEPGSPERSRLERVYGVELTAFMCEGVQHLAERFPEVRTERTRLIGPTMEGVGWYPAVRPDLRLPDTPAWVAGDSCGMFRGIVAAMISGHYAAARLKASLPAPAVAR